MIQLFKRWKWNRYIKRMKADIIQMMSAIPKGDMTQFADLSAFFAGLVDVGTKIIQMSTKIDAPPEVLERIYEILSREFTDRLNAASPELMADNGSKLTDLLNLKAESKTLQ